MEKSWKEPVQANNPLNPFYSELNLKNPHSFLLPPTLSFLNVTGDNIWVTTVKKDEHLNRAIVRMFDSEGRDSLVSGNLFVPFKKVMLTNMIEQDIKVMNGFNIPVGHWSIETIALQFNSEHSEL